MYAVFLVRMLSLIIVSANICHYVTRCNQSFLSGWISSLCISLFYFLLCKMFGGEQYDLARCRVDQRMDEYLS